MGYIPSKLLNKVAGGVAGFMRMVISKYFLQKDPSQFAFNTSGVMLGSARAVRRFKLHTILCDEKGLKELYSVRA